jgi:NAD(P)-dependent dehydrogenase (short-subunit alcohol dehydrogenase family)
LAALGEHGVLADIHPPDESLTQDVAGKFDFCRTDVTDENAVRAALGAAKDLFGPLRGVINCAGVIHGSLIIGADGPAALAEFRRVLEVNLVGTFNVLRLAADAMRHNEPNSVGERGVIINTGSIAAFEGQVGQSAYAASKGGVAALTLPAARELGRLGIRVVCIAPGAFQTPMMKRVAEKTRQSLEAQTPFPPRFGEPQEFAALVCHLLENPMLNGTIIRLDGGLRLPLR